MKLLNKKNLEIIKIASADQTRLALNGLYVDGDTTVATDGHRVIRVQTQSPAVEDWPANGVKWDKEEPFIMDKKTVEKALKNIPKKTDLPILQNVGVGLIHTDQYDPKKIVCQTTDLDTTDNVESKPIDGIYPDYKRIIPDYEDKEQYQCVAISAKYLKEVCMILEKYQEKSSRIQLYIKDENHSIVLTAEDDNETKATAIIMPMKL